MAKIYLIGNSHLDPVWLWRWQEGFSEIVATFRSALDRMNDYPDFKFTSACAVYYEWIEKLDPEMFAEIQQRVREGRWNIVGGWFLQPDCNMPCGESFARHALISQRYFKEKFGVMAKTGYNVDSFGHNAMLPQILKKSGMDNYVFMRPMPNEYNLPDDLFYWESQDGSKVCAHRIPLAYNIDMPRIDMVDKIRELSQKAERDYLAFYGVGNHGGGPTIALIDKINEMNNGDLVYSDTETFFETVDKSKLQTVKNELQHHARGCYSACATVKANNRRSENNLLAAEKLSVMANRLVNADFPTKKLNKAWKNTLFNQFHDILAGCAIKKAYDDASYLYGETMSITEQVLQLSIQKIARRIDTLQGETLPSTKDPKHWKTWQHEVLGAPIVVFNPHAWPVAMPIQINEHATKVTAPDGSEIPFQKVRGDQTNCNDLHHTAFIANVPAMGYAVYRVFVEKESEVEFLKKMTATENVLENDYIRVEFSKKTGDIATFYDKKQNKYIINNDCKAILLDETAADTWAHDKDYLGEKCGEFGNPIFKVIEDGNVRATVRVTTKYENSTLVRDFTITPDSNVVTVKTKVDFHEKHRVLKFTFPIGEEKVTAKIPYGTITRESNVGEEPCGSWIAANGIAVANDSKHGYDTIDGEMRLTVLRSAIYADHYGWRDEHCEYMEQGIHEFTYSVFPYTTPVDAERRAQELNFPLRYVVDSFHKGDLPETMGCFTSDNDNVIVTALKKAEDSNEMVIRMFEANGENTTMNITLFDKTLSFDISHNEILTLNENGNSLNLIEM